MNVTIEPALSMGSFLGSHAMNMDAKGRLAIPAKVREELSHAGGSRVVLTANAADDDGERCILLYPESQWGAVKSQIDALPNMSRAVRRLQRLMLGHAVAAEIDAAGRILIPPTLRRHAYLEKKLMLIGQGKKLELWSEERWNDWLDGCNDGDDVPPEMQALSL